MGVFGLSEIFDYISFKTLHSASSCSQMSPKCRLRAQENARVLPQTLCEAYAAETSLSVNSSLWRDKKSLVSIRLCWCI